MYIYTVKVVFLWSYLYRFPRLRFSFHRCERDWILDIHLARFSYRFYNDPLNL